MKQAECILLENIPVMNTVVNLHYVHYMVTVNYFVESPL